MRRTVPVFSFLFAAALSFLEAAPGDTVAGIPIDPAKNGRWVEVPFMVGTAKCNINGTAADRTSGDLYINPKTGSTSLGIWKSTDHGASFVRVDNGAVSGFGMIPFSMDMDPEGSRLAFFAMYGNGAMTQDAGKTWRSIGSHFDYGSVDWTDPLARTIITDHHEANLPGMRYSSNSGASWATLNLSWKTIHGVADSGTFLTGAPDGIRMSRDCLTWRNVCPIVPISPSSRMFKGAVYFMSHQGLLVSRDKGETWSVQGTALPDTNAWVGPYFGRDENHILVVGKLDIWESLDAGQTWHSAVKPFASIIGVWPFTFPQDGTFLAQGGTFLGYDPDGDIFYISSSMDTWPVTPGRYNHSLLRFVRGQIPNRIERRVEKGGEILKNAPNPFNPMTEISFANPGQQANLSIYDIRGARVAEFKKVTGNRVVWNAGKMASGVYIVEAIVGNRISAKAMFLQK